MQSVKEKEGLFAVYPELEDYWCWEENNELGIYPNKISPNSHIKVYLRCRKCNEPHLRQVRQYINANGICLYCNHRRIKPGVNDRSEKNGNQKPFFREVLFVVEISKKSQGLNFLLPP